MSILSNIQRTIRPRSAACASATKALSGVLAVEPTAFEAMLAELGARAASAPASEIRAFIASVEDGGASSPIYSVMDGVGCIAIDGYIVADAFDAALMRFFLVPATSTEEIMGALSAAIADPRCESIQLNINSPGGTVTGVPECAAAIAEAAEMKPVEACVRGMACSAAYYMASQAGSIEAEPSALIGSIGTFCTLTDTSKLFSAVGIKVHLISSGPYKGAGTPGTEVTDKQIAAAQRQVDALTAMFTTSVARGRQMSMEAIRALATGESWFADDAKAKGLVDLVATPSIAPMEATVQAPAPHREPDGDEDGDEAPARPATYASVRIDFGASDLSIPSEPHPDPAAAIATSTISPEVMTNTFTKPTPANELEALRAENEALKAANSDLGARAQMAEAFATQAKETEISAVIDKHVAAGRVTPAMRPKIAEAAKTFLGRPNELDSMLATFPVQVKPTATGQAPTGPWMEPKETESQLAGATVAEVHAFERRFRSSIVTLEGKAQGSILDTANITSLRRGRDGSYVPAEQE